MKFGEPPVSMLGSMKGKYLLVMSYSTKNPNMSIVVCPHCGRHIRYQTAVSYFCKTGCPNCIGDLRREIDAARKADPQGWERRDWEPFGTYESEDKAIRRQKNEKQ